MKYFILAFLLVMGSAVADVQESHVLYEDDARLTLADPKRPGSSTTIEIDGKVYPLGSISEQARLYRLMLAKKLPTHGGTTFKGKAVGIIVKSKGFFPAPRIEMEGFQALYLEFAIPVTAPGKPGGGKTIIRFPSKKGDASKKDK